MLNAAIAQMLRQASGLALSADTVQRAMRDRMKLCGIDDVDLYAVRARQPAELSALLELVVVHETWLFRDPEAFVAATDFVRTRLATVNRPIRVLSIPCSSGEEPYSIAMSLLDAGIAASRVLIDGLDISPEVLDTARCAVYGRNAFRSRELSFRERYFKPVAGGYQLDAKVRAMVRFGQGNLLTIDTNAGAGMFDVIFCRNLLIYFDEATQQAAVRKLRLLLHDDGILLAGYAEIPVFFQQGFAVIDFPKAFALRKKELANTLTAEASTRRKPAAAIGHARLKPVTRTRSAAAAQLKAPAAVPMPLPAPVAVAQANSTALALDAARGLADGGDFEGARTALVAYLRQVPDSAQAYFLLGLTSERLGDPIAAESNLRRAIYLAPDYYDALCHLALFTEQAGKAADAAALKARAARVLRRQAAAQNKERP